MTGQEMGGGGVGVGGTLVLGVLGPVWGRL